jgi:vitamin B12 transporter
MSVRVSALSGDGRMKIQALLLLFSAVRRERARARAAARARTIASGLALVTCASAIAQSPSQPPPPQRQQSLDPVIVTATRISQPVSSQLSDVRVIDATDLANAGNQTLVEVLQTQAGLEVASNGGPGQPTAVFVRGSNANHVVILVDGIRINSATTGTNALEHVPVSSIERIEIVKGPASSLYGADAIGGVIQIFTRRERTTASLGAGTWRTHRIDASWFRELGSLKLGVRAGDSESAGFSATNAANVFSFNPDRDAYRNRNAGVSAEYDLARGQSLSLSGSISDAVTHFDSGPASDDVNRQRLTTVAVESRNRLSDGWTSVLKLARGSDHLKVEGSFPARFDTDQDQVTWQNDLSTSLGAIAAGIEYRREAIDSTTAYSNMARSIRSVFGSWSGSAGPHLAQASLRRDDNSQFGARTTGNAGYGYRFLPGWRASVSAGTAFKAPSFNDLYFTSPYFSGNPSLKPERSRSVEGAIRYDHGPVVGGLTVFHNRVRDLIAVDPTFTTVVNVNQARIRGATLNSSIDAFGLRIKGEITHEEATDEATGRMLPRRARNYGSATVSGQSGQWKYGADLVVAGYRFDSVSNVAATRLPGYGLVNLRTGYVFTPAWSVNMRWNNILDRSYELVRGYNTAGSNVFVSVDYSAR